MEATCPCHRIFTAATDYHEHLVEEHGANPDQAFLVTQLALLDVCVYYSITPDGDIFLAGFQLPLWPVGPRRAA